MSPRSAIALRQLGWLHPPCLSSQSLPSSHIEMLRYRSKEMMMCRCTSSHHRGITIGFRSLLPLMLNMFDYSSILSVFLSMSLSDFLLIGHSLDLCIFLYMAKKETFCLKDNLSPCLLHKRLGKKNHLSPKVSVPATLEAMAILPGCYATAAKTQQRAIVGTRGDQMSHHGFTTGRLHRWHRHHAGHKGAMAVVAVKT